MPLHQSLALDVGNWLPPGCVLHTRIPHCRRIHWRELLPYSFFQYFYNASRNMLEGVKWSRGNDYEKEFYMVPVETGQF